MDNKYGKGGHLRGGARGKGRVSSRKKQNDVQGRTTGYGEQGTRSDYERSGKGRNQSKSTSSIPGMEIPSPNYFTCDNIDDLSRADDQTVTMRITQNEHGFMKAFKHEKFIKAPKVLKQLIVILYKLVKSSDLQTALPVLAQLFGSSGEYALFLFHLQQLIGEMISERKQFIKEENLQPLYHLTEIGKFCFKKIPKTVQNTFPIQVIRSAVESLINYSSGSEIEQVILEDIEQNLIELQVQRLSFEEELVRPKPKPRRRIGDVDREPPESFTTLPILPLPEEINHYAQKPYLRPNIVEGAYQSWEHYLDVQFRLLREDFVGPLREGIDDHLKNPTLKGGDVRVYRNVRIRQPVCLAMGIGFEVSFNMKALRRVNWEYTKRLINGSLLCLSTDDFQTIIAFASVAQRERKQLKKGIVTVIFEGSVNGFQLHPQAEYTMVESVAYLEAYRHVLERLQAVSEEHEIDMMPFEQYIVRCTYDDIPLPRYLNHFGHTFFDLKGIIEIKNKFASSSVDLTRVSSWPDAKDTNLNPSQMRALQAALTQEISVIQGPPGTGKTYVGMKIVKAFLANRKVWDPLKTTPILVVCHTNHALDQFLEGIRSDEIDGKPPNVTRIGGRCKSEILKECTIQEKVSKAQTDRTVPGREYRDYREARGTMMAKKDEIIKYLESVHISAHKILRIDRLRGVISANHYNQLVNTVYTDNPIELWLGLQYEDPNIEDEATPENPAFHENLPTVEDELQVLEENFEEEDTEVQMVQDDRLVEGNEIIFRATDQEWVEVTPKKRETGGWQVVQMDEQKKRKLIYKQLNRNLRPMSDMEAASIYDIWMLDKTQKWRLYIHWRDSYVSFLRQKLELQSGAYKVACEEFQMSKQSMDLTIIRDSDVVGMTTTGAAKHSYIIKSIRPKIVVVEEAAEIFEPHIFTSLSPTVQQLILIGDHQQLRPKPTYYELEAKYDFNVSLFERLAKNGCPVQRLGIQHRMRPEIASLITPAVYAELLNHESVHKYGHVQGIGKNLYFISHTEPEKTGTDDRKNHSNPHEAKFLCALCDYLLKQGYKSNEITILTLYRGQLLEIKNILRLRKINGVRTAVVDDFQGEENRIVLLSLVRSNNEQKIGFVGIENRICVALSRAKMSLFIIGNVLMLRDKVTTIWPKVIEKLESMDSIGEALPLHCHIHQDQRVNARVAEDFLRCPEGGCQKKCDARLPCGHVCRRLCHPYDVDHLDYKCLQNCSKKLACGHQCKRKCYQCVDGCKPCQEKVAKFLPQCGHSQKVACSKDPLTIQCNMICEKPLPCGHFCQEKCSQPCTKQCTVKVDKKLPCGHTVKDSCYLKEDLVQCNNPCGALLDCEHPCPGTCHDCKMGRLHVGCKSKCDRTLTCGHLCDFTCTPSCPPCSKPCANFCIHSHCTKKCFEPCTPCMEPCEWSCPHFQCTQLCGMPCDRPPCNQPCRKRLECGHRCIGLCGEPCPKLCRVCNKDVVTEIFFGDEDEKDARFVLLPDCKHIFEVKGLDQWMSTESETSETAEITLKVCPRCKTPVRKCLRYGNSIKNKVADVEAVKKKQMSTIESINLPAELAKTESAVRKASTLSRHFISEELSSIGTMVEQECRAGSRGRISIVFPHIVKAKLSFLKQILSTVQIFERIKSRLLSVSFRYHLKIEKAKTHLCQLKTFIMQEFLSHQQLSDAEAESRRLTLLAKATELQVEASTKLSKEDSDLLNQVVSVLEVSGWKAEKISEEFESKLLTTYKHIREKYSIGKLSDTEKLMIVKAIGLPKGHWYKCPNGHIYAIGECGGAMQTGNCPECKAVIGGGNHALASGNRHAPEMDDSRHAAWSEAANLANFDPGEFDRL